jgi:radical SAM superfamily enzyme YgiQ (UPF0313 family)
MRVLLVNTNTVRPPIAPIGLDYLADALGEAGAEVGVLDLGLEPGEAGRRVSAFGPDVVGLTVRNTDDCYFVSRDFFLPGVRAVVEEVRAATDAPLVLGGVGFSVMPEAVLDRCGVSLGIVGEGEFSFPELATRLAAGRPIEAVPGLVRRDGSRYVRTPVRFGDLSALPVPSRRRVDNARYFREGGQIGFETQRGCDRSCTYCPEPGARGRRVRRRRPERVVAEIRNLLDQGIDHLHTCDSEFNLSEGHVLDVCAALEGAGLVGRVRWYAYCTPRPFSRGMAEAMARAGCAGIDFGVDHVDEGILRRLGRDHRREDVEAAAEACRSAGIPFMFDLLLGGPGETRETLRDAVETMKRLEPSRVGLSVGIRVYPGTRFAAEALRESSALRPALDREPDLVRPVFYFSPALGEEIFPLLGDLVGGDRRFLFADPSRKGQNYNYNANRLLEEAIAAGHRGAYWDILRRLESGG